jgi:hypothetical protein
VTGGRISLGVMVAIWATVASPALANPLSTVEETAGSVAPPPKVETVTPPLPSVDPPPAVKTPSPPAPSVSPPPAPTVPPPTADSGVVGSVQGTANSVAGTAAGPAAENAAGGASGNSPGVHPNPSPGSTATSSGGFNSGSGTDLGLSGSRTRPGVSGSATDPGASGSAANHGVSTPAVGRGGRANPHFNASIPRWLAYVWPAIALGPVRALIGTLTSLLAPGAGAPLVISAPAALLALRDALRGNGAALAPADAIAASHPNKPLSAQFNDSGPGALNMLIFITALLLLSYFVIRSRGGGPGGTRHSQDE